MKLNTTKGYLQDLDAATKRYSRLLELFHTFFAGASHLAAADYPLKGITITSVSPTEFDAQFLGTIVRFTFSYDHTALRGVVAVTTTSADDRQAGLNWTFQFNGQGEVGGIEPRLNEGAYNVAIGTDAAEIVLGALHSALVKKIEAP